MKYQDERIISWREVLLEVTIDNYLYKIIKPVDRIKCTR